jgi:hypothetical protein
MNPKKPYGVGSYRGSSSRHPFASDTYSLDQKSPPFSPLFTCEGNIDYTGCGSTEQRGRKAGVVPSLPSCPDKLEERCWGACFALWWKQGLPFLPSVWAKMFSCKLLSIVLIVTITSKVMVYPSAEMADTSHLVLLYPFLLCGLCYLRDLME